MSTNIQFSSVSPRLHALGEGEWNGYRACRTGSLALTIGLALCCAFPLTAVLAQERPAPAPGNPQLVRERIEFLHKRQAEYLKKVASGDVRPDAGLRDKWPGLREDVASIHGMIGALNALDAGDPKRAQLESTLRAALQPVGPYLLPAEPPALTPRKVEAAESNELARIESAIAAIDYVDRGEARPVEVMGSFPVYTLINLPVPLVFTTRPGERIFLYAETGGVFSNGLVAIELEADENGSAATTWVTNGDSVGTSCVSVFSGLGAERLDLVIEVVAPVLALPDGVPAPDDAFLPAAPVLRSGSVLRGK